jgi:hypothetical protein
MTSPQRGQASNASERFCPPETIAVSDEAIMLVQSGIKTTCRYVHYLQAIERPFRCPKM